VCPLLVRRGLHDFTRVGPETAFRSAAASDEGQDRL
jgi:hypothetical protein